MTPETQNVICSSVWLEFKLCLSWLLLEFGTGPRRPKVKILWQKILW